MSLPGRGRSNSGNEELGLKRGELLHLFAQLPVVANNKMVPVIAVSLEDAKSQVEKLHKLKLTPAEHGGRQGYRDQSGSFYVFFVIDSIESMGEAAEILGIDTEEGMAQLLGRKLI